MSGTKKLRNIKRLAFMRNFTNNTIERYILMEIDDMNDNEKDLFVSKINEKLWYAIQKVNEITNYNLPYVLVRRVESSEHNNKLRIIIKPDDYDFNPEPRFISGKESHVILMKQLSPQRIIQLGNMDGIGKAEILADENSKIVAAIDIFLDIAMFNSISYLRKLNEEERLNFNQIKYEYYLEENLESYFYINPNDPPSYISFAFSQHKDHDELDYYGYIICWEKFLKKYYPNQVNKNPPPIEQLKKHEDFNNIDDLYKSEDFWKLKPSGAYLLLRVNKRPTDTEREEKILNYFGCSTYHIGLIKVIPLQEYHMPYIRKEFEELNVSAFKIIID